MNAKHKTVLVKAGSLLMDAAGMLRIEAREWLDRRSYPVPQWEKDGWSDRCERIAQTNIAAATSMEQTAKQLAELATEDA
jgi:hypothetical protein